MAKKKKKRHGAIIFGFLGFLRFRIVSCFSFPDFMSERMQEIPQFSDIKIRCLAAVMHVYRATMTFF